MSNRVDIFAEILKRRGLDDEAKREAFLHPSYEHRHDPFLLPDMQNAVTRLVRARELQQRITIYGDYDIDGLTATTVLLEAFNAFGFEHVETFIPNRFVEGYGLTLEAVEKIAKSGAEIIITVDCGSLSTSEIERANELGVDVIVTDHHNVLAVQPPAVAVINPKRLLQDFPEMYEGFVLKPEDEKLDLQASDSGVASEGAVGSSRAEAGSKSLQSAGLDKPQTSSTGQDFEPALAGFTKAPSEATPASSLLYPFLDLPGVGVAFKLVQALQTHLPGLENGQEKWLLDLVALGTVCDVVTLVDENRMHVFWGLQVLAKTRRPGLKALMAVARVEPSQVNARSLGFGLGPRMNAAGRLETAQIALDMLRASDGMEAFERAQQLDALNTARRADQDTILKAALEQAKIYENDNVLVVSSPDWNHGIIGIVAAKLLEKFHKPTFVLQELGLESKGSARSYGDFSAADAIRAADDIITKGGGHAFAAGVTLPTKNIPAFRERVNKFYASQLLTHAQQASTLLPCADATTELEYIDEALIAQIAALEPFGSGNPQPILLSKQLRVMGVRRMGADGQHIKLELQPEQGKSMQFLAFNAPEHFFVDIGTVIDVWYQPDVNEWQGRRSVEGKLLHVVILDSI